MIHLEGYHQGYIEKNKISLMGFFSLRLRLRYNQPISIKRKKIIHLMRTQNWEPSNETTISSWCTNEVQPSLDNLVAIASLLKI